MKKGEEKMLTVEEAANKLGAAVVSVRVWARTGRFPGAQREDSPRGPYWLIPESALEGFQMSKPGPKPGSKRKGKIKE
ncbi:MAG TPA: helix-turn-helix domain-containing protein [Blastocatellia bacterium]|nr:helix-turn-helix domain-containing protein [Blastocatellia bacterium]